MLKPFIALAFVAFVSPVFALSGGVRSSNGNGGMPTVELRGNYGTWQAPSDFNSSYTDQVASFPTLGSPTVIGGDLLFQVPGLPVVIGGRYETFSIKSASANFTYNSDNFTDFNNKLQASRTSVLLGIRKTNGIGFMGIIGSYGVSQSCSLTQSYTLSGTPGGSDMPAKLTPSYSGGLEMGIRVGFLEFGGEAGYLSFKATEFDDPTNNNKPLQNGNVNVTADLSGFYWKGFVGFAF